MALSLPSKFPSVKEEMNMLTADSSAEAKSEIEGWARAASMEWQRGKLD